MKNIHVLPTNEISKLIKNIWKNTYSIVESFNRNHTDFKGQYMYITSSDVIEKGEWCIDSNDEVFKFKKFHNYNHYKKIILTNDLELIKDGIQAIEDSFIEWFVNNSTCDFIKVENLIHKVPNRFDDDYRKIPYLKIVIPKDFDEMMEVPMSISKVTKKEYTEQDMLLAAKYGYDFHKTTSFPEQEFDDSCVRNTQQWLTTFLKNFLK